VVKVTIQTSEFMDGQAFSSDFGNQMNEIASKQVREVELYKRKSEKTPPFLVKKMSLAAGGSVSAAPTPVHTEGNSDLRPNGHSSAMNPPPMAGHVTNKIAMARPQEVTQVAMLLFFSAGVGIVVGIVAILVGMSIAGAIAESGAEAGTAATFGGIVMLLACLPLIFGIGQVVVGIGVLKMKKWAWYGAFVFAVLAILSAASQALRFNIFAIFRIALNVGVIRSLIQTSEAFEN
jgi:hypothetical protein